MPSCEKSEEEVRQTPRTDVSLVLEDVGGRPHKVVPARETRKEVSRDEESQVKEQKCGGLQVGDCFTPDPLDCLQSNLYRIVQHRLPSLGIPKVL